MFSYTLSRASLRAHRTARPGVGAVRNLNVHEYVAMDLFQKHGIPTPQCHVASTPEEAENVFSTKLNKPGEKPKDVVIKAQVLTWGRRHGHFKNGFQGGVHVITKPGQARDFASKMLGQELVTKRAPNGKICNKVLLMERMYLRREMYFSILMDRVSQSPLLVASPCGGIAIDEIAARNPELIYTEPVDIIDGIVEDQCLRMATNLGLDEGSEAHTKAAALVRNLYQMFINCDCTQIGINPLVETPEGDIIACDAKVNFDSNAEFRQPAIFEKRDRTQQDPREVEAAENDLNYIGMKGNIGCMVNGAGLAMATMDIIKMKGGSPANFLDVGGGADETQVQRAFAILNTDPSVKCILVYIFGGIQRCDVIASGIIKAATEIGLQKPIVIRLQGTNVNEANTLIGACSFKMILADDLEDAAEKAIGVADIASQAEKIHVGVKFDGLDL